MFTFHFVSVTAEAFLHVCSPTSHRNWKWLVPAQEMQLLYVQEFCEPTVKDSHFKLHKLKISYTILEKQRLINIPNSSFPNYFTIFYYYLCSWVRLHVLHWYDRDSTEWCTTTPLPNFSFSDITLVVWNSPLQYLLHWNWKKTANKSLPHPVHTMSAPQKRQPLLNICQHINTH